MLDFIDPAGEIADSLPMPSDIRYIAGIDHGRDVIWLRGDADLVAALYRIPLDRRD